MTFLQTLHVGYCRQSHRRNVDVAKTGFWGCEQYEAMQTGGLKTLRYKSKACMGDIPGNPKVDQQKQ